MAKLNFDLDDLTNAALKRMVKQLLTASDADEKSILQQLESRAKRKPEKNDLADLDEEMHGKPDTPMVEDDEIPDGEELPDVPNQKKRKS
jgi:hypothetical protein